MTVLPRTLTFLLVLLSMQSFAKPRHFKVTLMVPPGTDEKKLWVSYDDGNIYHRLTPHLVNNQMELSGVYNAHYATINIAYAVPGAEEPVRSRHWVSEQPATIRITDDWQHPVVTNAQNIDEAGGAAYKACIATAEEQKNAYWEAHSEAIMKLGSPERQVFFEKMKMIDSLKLTFVQQRKNTYYALWLFEQELMWMGHVVPYGYPKVTPAQLRTLLGKVVPEKKEYAFERKLILDGLTNLEVGVGVKAPVFAERDIYGKKVSLADYKGKYVLLDFWASWCEPCVAELPAIKKVYHTYGRDKLEVIGVSGDKDSTAFLKTVDKYGVSWTKLYNKEALVDRYGVRAWPTLFLIDPSGRIVYDRDQEVPETIDSLPLLQEVLRARFDK